MAVKEGKAIAVLHLKGASQGNDLTDRGQAKGVVRLRGVAQGAAHKLHQGEAAATVRLVGKAIGEVRGPRMRANGQSTVSFRESAA